MDTETFERLIADAPTSVKVKGVTLFNAVTATMKSYKAEPTAANLKDWQAAEAALEEFAAGLGESQAAFASIAEALEHLKAVGWKITRPSLYRHHQEGKLIARDGVFRRQDVDRYAKTWLKRADTGRRQRDDIDELQRKKADGEVKRLNLEIEQRKLILERDAGRLVPREQMEIELAGRAAVLDAGLKHWVHANAMEWVRLVSGEVHQAGALIRAMVQSLDEHINNYAAPRDYRVVIDDEPAPDGGASEEENPC